MLCYSDIPQLTFIRAMSQYSRSALSDLRTGGFKSQAEVEDYIETRFACTFETKRGKRVAVGRPDLVEDLPYYKMEVDSGTVVELKYGVFTLF